jgi:hypothetical protein
MFNNRKFEVKLVKDDQKVEQVDKPVNIDDLTETVVGGAIVVIGAYMLGDTIRKCVCHAVATRMG